MLFFQRINRNFFSKSLLLSIVLKAITDAQLLNLGSFNLNRNPLGDLEVALRQGGSLLGFGGDRSLGLTLGPGRFGARTDNGVLLGGERIGLDSNIGLQEGQGLSLGNLLQLGNGFGSSGGPLEGLFDGLGSLLQPRAKSGSIEPRGRGFGQPIGPQQPPPQPTLIPNIHSGSGKFEEIDPGDSGDDNGDQQPLSVGRGWDDYDNNDAKSFVPTTIPEPISNTRPDQPEVDPFEVRFPPSRNNQRPGGINTEGSSRIRPGNRYWHVDKEEAIDAVSNKHDGNAKPSSEEDRSRKRLPIPDGLVPIR